jgi:hypothetical protein
VATLPKARIPGKSLSEYAAGLRRLVVFVVRMMEQAGGPTGERRDVAKTLLGMVDSSGAVAQVRAAVAAGAAGNSVALTDAALEACLHMLVRLLGWRCG